MTRKIPVTGRAGFLGSHLCERLLYAGNDYLCVDNFFTGNKDNAAHLMGNLYLELMRHDATFPLYVEVDQIYKLVCQVSQVQYQLDSAQITKTSVHGAINMLGLAKWAKVISLQALTSEMHGDPEVRPQPEICWGKVNLIGIQSCYVDDLVDVMSWMMDSPVDLTGPVNSGNPGKFTILELAKIISLSCSRSKRIFKSLPSDDPKQRQPDIGLVNQLFGWEPKISLEDSLKRAVVYFAERV